MAVLPLWVRDADSRPPDNPQLTVNLVFRLMLCPLALMGSWVPFKLLSRNGEFAATVMTATNWIIIFFMFVNAAIWHDNNSASWWKGDGWCDMQTYTHFSLTTLYAACVCAIMRRLAKQVGLNRMAELSPRERRNHVLIQSLIIFPVPLIQAALTILVQSQRYTVMAINGCGLAFEANVIYLIFFILPSPIFTLAACVHCWQTYRQFRDVQRTTRLVLNSNNSFAVSRSKRTKFKLYVMTAAILVPYAAIEFAFLAFNVIQGWPWAKRYDFHQLHYGGSPPWNTVARIRFDDVSFVEMNMSWVSVITVLLIIYFFGAGVEAINIYRKSALELGLGRLFPALAREYDPDRPKTQDGPPTWNTKDSGKTESTAATGQSRKGSLGPSSHHLSGITAVSSPSNAATTPDPRAATMWIEDGQPDVYPSAPPQASSRRAATTAPRILNPGLDWTKPPKLPSLSIPSIFKRSAEGKRKKQAAPPLPLVGISRDASNPPDTTAESVSSADNERLL